MKRIRTGIVGLGRIGWGLHCAEVEKHEGFQAVAMVDALPERREEAEAKYGVNAYADCEAMFAAEQLDLVVIASPTEFHREHALTAFKNGCDVFCDKPMALSLAQADEMIAAAKQYGRKLMVFQPWRLSPHSVALQEILGKNLIGSVYMIKRGHCAFRRREDWQAFRKHGGGMLNNYGAHFIDQVMYLAGFPANRVNCTLKTVAALGDADDVVKAVIETEGGVTLDVDISMAAAYPIPPYYVLGQYGSIMMDQEAEVWKVKYFRPEELPDVAIQTSMAADNRAYFLDDGIPWREESFPMANYARADFYARVYEYFAEDKDPIVPLAESRELMRVLDACRQDAGWGDE